MNIKKINDILSENMVVYSKNAIFVKKARTLLDTLPDIKSELHFEFKTKLEMIVALAEDITVDNKKPRLNLVVLSNASDGVITVKVNGVRYEYKLKEPMEPVNYAKFKTFAAKSPQAAINRLRKDSTAYRSEKFKVKQWKPITEDVGIIPTAQSRTANNGITVANNPVSPSSNQQTPAPSTSQPANQQNNQLKPGTLKVVKDNQIKIISANDLMSYQQQGWQVVGQDPAQTTTESFGGTCAGSVASVAAPLGSVIKRTKKKKNITIKEDGEQYSNLEDVYPAGNTKIYYTKSEFGNEMSEGFEWLEKNGKLPDVSDLDLKYVLVGTMRETDPEKIYGMMQGDVWSPGGEATELITRLGCGHTSMGVGDIIQSQGHTYFLDLNGFKELDQGLSSESYVNDVAESLTLLSRHKMLMEKQGTSVICESTVADVTSRLRTLATQSKLVESFEIKSSQILNQIKRLAETKNPQLYSALYKYTNIATSNPRKQGLVNGILTAASCILNKTGSSAATEYLIKFSNGLVGK